MGTFDDTASALFPKTKRAILTMLFGHPTEQFHVREIMRRAGPGQGAVQRELEVLERAGILHKERDGNRVLYRANGQSPVYGELQGIMRKTSGLLGVLQQALVPFVSKIHVAAIYGSLAKGGGQAGSDVDVLVVGSVSFKELVKALKLSQDRLGRAVNVTVYTEEEARRLLKAKHHFLTSVMQDYALYIFGDRHEFERLAR